MRRVFPSASCRPTMSASAARITSATLPKSTTSPPSQTLNDITVTSAGTPEARGACAPAAAGAAQRQDQHDDGDRAHGRQSTRGRGGAARNHPPRVMPGHERAEEAEGRR